MTRPITVGPGFTKLLKEEAIRQLIEGGYCEHDAEIIYKHLRELADKEKRKKDESP